MKYKLIIVLIILIMVCGCSRKKDVLIINNVETSIINKEEDNNPITVGLYHKNKLINHYNSKFKNNTEIATFNLFYTNQKDVSGYNVKYNFKRFYNKYENIDEYKMGFYVFFMVDDKAYEKVILDPSTTHSLSPYILLYLYDGYHQKDGARYSHLETSNMKDNTVFTSIKFYCYKCEQLTSPIYLEAFTYKDGDIIDNRYTGKSKYSIIIYNQ